MRKRQLGNSDLYVSEMSLGCMSLGTNEKKARTIIEAALEEGVNYFDTADLYDHGENEKIVGQAFKDVRKEVIIASKGGNRWNEAKDGWSWDPSKNYLKDAVKYSLDRLQTDYIDLYQLHGGTIEDPIEETIEAFEELKAEGLIRHYGISSIRPNVIREYLKKSSIVSVMMQYSILDRRPEEEALPLLQERGVSVVTRGSVAKGLLSELYFEKASNGKGFLDYRSGELLEVLPLLKEKVASARALEEVALQYNLANPAVASVVTGSSTVEQVRANARAVNSEPLTSEQVSLIHALTKASQYQEHR
ncbi:aldo/keto reductase [Mesobacillus foraminis]|uniref:Aryl-alcohol dehydrogenase-like predicted oxidoreductase n=1 Tax=Mesobacillus foraminis TaxID=279826 RepID=A0A4R2B8B1_9BACI|nr:aldo/keto reductase [Mesobacillus foraminis]TCN22967.1 aryl-alcohol dehydrogenase-like predicted oxidoreductase [Mesobacillus foraminis]